MQTDMGAFVTCEGQLLYVPLHLCMFFCTFTCYITVVLLCVEILKERGEKKGGFGEPEPSWAVFFAHSQCICLPLCLFLLLSPDLDAVCCGTCVWIMLDSSETM